MLIGKSVITLNQQTMVTAVQAWVDAHWKGSHQVKVIKITENGAYKAPTDFQMEIESVTETPDNAQPNAAT